MKKSLEKEIRAKWPSRPKNSHKGDFGKVLIVAGSRGMLGAADLAASAALRTGAGLVSLAVPDSIYSILARRVPADVMLHPFPSTSGGALAFRALKPMMKLAEKQSVLAVGPGLSQDPQTSRLIRALIQKSDLPVVLDADGLNAFSGHAKELKCLSGRSVLTPHPGEFQRLFGVKVPVNDSGRIELARQSAKKYHVALVLKGFHSVVADDQSVFVNRTGNPGMAKGGFGDVLTGMIAALLGQGFSLRDSARFGVYLHGLAADRLVKTTGEVSLMASDLLDQLPKAIRQIRKC